MKLASTIKTHTLYSYLEYLIVMIMIVERYHTHLVLILSEVVHPLVRGGLRIDGDATDLGARHHAVGHDVLHEHVAVVSLRHRVVGAKVKLHREQVRLVGACKHSVY